MYTDLEIWEIQNADLITENEISKRGVIRLEVWAYHKYKELNPSLPMLKGLGIDNAERLDPNGTTKSNKSNLYSPARFDKKSVDKITNFGPSIDILGIDTDTFGIDGSIIFAAGKKRKPSRRNLPSRTFISSTTRKKAGSTSTKMVQTRALEMVASSPSLKVLLMAIWSSSRASSSLCWRRYHMRPTCQLSAQQRQKHNQLRSDAKIKIKSID